jgi:hypothetical protein
MDPIVLKKIDVVILEKVLPQAIPFLAGFFTAIFAEPIRRGLFKPNLKLDFNNNSDYVALTPERVTLNNNTIEAKAYYIRIKVTNTRRIAAKECKAYLVNIEKLDSDGHFKSTIYCDSISLAWSCQNMGEQHAGIDINKGVNQYADVITTRHLISPGEVMYPGLKSTHPEPDILYPQIKLLPFRYEKIFKEQGTFRFTIQVTSANADPKTIRLILEWKGVWDQFSARTG